MMESKEKPWKRVIMPSAMMAVIGLLVGAGVGPAAGPAASIFSAGDGDAATPEDAPLTAGVFGSVDAPTSVVEGQRFAVSIRVTAKDPALGALFSMQPEPPTESVCSITGFEATGGVALGNGLYAILPQPPVPSDTDLDVIPTGYVTFSWHAVADKLGNCEFGGILETVLGTDAATHIKDVVSVLPDISTTTIDLGHVKTVGGMWIPDEAKTITPPAASEVTVVTSSSRFLAMMEATISHDDGTSWKDTGRFTVTPDVSGDLLDYLDIGLDIEWSMTLTDDGDTVAPWLTIGQFGATEDGLRNQACLTGSYYDNDDKKGSKSHCVDVIGKRDDALSIAALDDGQRNAVDVLLARTGHAFIPSGTPNVYYYFEDVESTAEGD